MRRVLANSCFTWFFCKLAAVYLPQVASLLLAAFCVCMAGFSFYKGWKDYRLILPIAGVAALCSSALSFMLVTQPILNLAGSEHAVSVVAHQVRTSFEDGSVQGKFKVLSMDGQPLSSGRQFYVTISSFPESEPGEIFETTLRFQPLETGPYKMAYMSQNVFVQAEVVDTARWVGQSRDWTYSFMRLRQELAAKCRRYLPSEEGGVLAAMALGEDSHLSKEVEEAYRKVGISHLLVVSGQHLTLLCGLMIGTQPFMSQNRKIRAIFALLAVAFLVALNGFEPSITRAGIAALFTYLGVFFMLPVDSITSVAVASMVLSLTGSHAVANLGLQLSLAATMAVILSEMATERWTSYMVKMDQPLVYYLAKIGTVLLVPVLCAIFTLPIQLMANLSVSSVSIFANLMVMPFISGIVVLGLLVAVLAWVPWLEGLVRFLALIAGVLIQTMNHVVEWLETWPVSQLVLHREFTTWIVVAALGLAWFCVRVDQKKQMFWGIPVAVVGAVIVHLSMMQNLVYLTLVGSPNNPCAILWEHGQTLVVFQGSQDNLQAVEQELAFRGLEDTPQVWVDLRRNPTELSLPGQTVWQLESFAERQTQEHTLGEACVIYATHTRDTNLVLIDIKGYRIGMLAGTGMFGSALELDLAITGSNQPERVEAAAIASCKPYDWHENLSDEVEFYYFSKRQRLHILPYHSVELWGD